MSLITANSQKANQGLILNQLRRTNCRIRPRFSLRWFLITFTVLSVLFFVLTVYPTTKAKHFVAGINNGSIDVSDELPWERRAVSKATAEIRPCTWGDLFKIRRQLNVTFDVANPASYSSQLIEQVGVTPFGYQLIQVEERETKAAAPTTNP